MAAGELYVKYHSGMTTVSASSRYSYSNGVFTQNNSGQWVDAYKEWGLSFSETSLSALMTPAPNKSNVENKSRLLNGKQVSTNMSLRKKDERDINIEMHITAANKTAFMQRYDRVCSYLFDYGRMEVINGYIPTKVYRLDYLNCSQFKQFMQQIAKFTLRVNEPDPTNRSI